MLQVSFNHSAWCTVSGPTDELNLLLGELQEWMRSVDGEADPRLVARATQDDTTVKLLTGTALCLGVDMHSLLYPEEEQKLDTMLTQLKQGGLRPYQADAVRAAFVAPGGRSILSVPMGGGKTYIAAAIAGIGSVLGLQRWLYVVTNRELARQAARGFDKWLTTIRSAIPEANPDISAVSYSKLTPSTWDGIIVDECHGLPARTRMDAYLELECSGLRVGMSGTPLDRTDKNNVVTMALLGPVAYTTDVKDLEDAGAISKGRVHQVVYHRGLGKLLR